MTVQELLKQHDKLRLSNKNQWVGMSAIVGSHSLFIKSYNTSIQILRVWGPVVNFKDSGPIDCTVKAYKDYITQTLKPLEVNK